jgi:3-hydroxymyristoyl/3-hydroxydecanoyl-(acyl carrier protein) dehydratase
LSEKNEIQGAYDMTQTTLVFPATHPVFAGHFPGQPIVPGVLLLDHARLVIETDSGQRCCGIATAKFHSPAGPDEVMTIDYQRSATFINFEICCGPRKIADGRFSL